MMDSETSKAHSYRKPAQDSGLAVHFFRNPLFSLIKNKEENIKWADIEDKPANTLARFVLHPQKDKKLTTEEILKALVKKVETVADIYSNIDALILLNSEDLNKDVFRVFKESLKHQDVEHDILKAVGEPNGLTFLVMNTAMSQRLEDHILDEIISWMKLTLNEEKIAAAVKLTRLNLTWDAMCLLVLTDLYKTKNGEIYYNTLREKVLKTIGEHHPELSAALRAGPKDDYQSVISKFFKHHIGQGILRIFDAIQEENQSSRCLPLAKLTENQEIFVHHLRYVSLKCLIQEKDEYLNQYLEFISQNTSYNVYPGLQRLVYEGALRAVHFITQHLLNYSSTGIKSTTQNAVARFVLSLISGLGIESLRTPVYNFAIVRIVSALADAAEIAADFKPFLIDQNQASEIQDISDLALKLTVFVVKSFITEQTSADFQVIVNSVPLASRKILEVLAVGSAPSAAGEEFAHALKLTSFVQQELAQLSKTGVSVPAPSVPQPAAASVQVPTPTSQTVCNVEESSDSTYTTQEIKEQDIRVVKLSAPQIDEELSKITISESNKVKETGNASSRPPVLQKIFQSVSSTEQIKSDAPTTSFSRDSVVGKENIPPVEPVAPVPVNVPQPAPVTADPTPAQTYANTSQHSDDGWSSPVKKDEPAVQQRSEPINIPAVVQVPTTPNPSVAVHLAPHLTAQIVENKYPSPQFSDDGWNSPTKKVLPTSSLAEPSTAQLSDDGWNSPAKAVQQTAPAPQIDRPTAPAPADFEEITTPEQSDNSFKDKSAEESKNASTQPAPTALNTSVNSVDAQRLQQAAAAANISLNVTATSALTIPLDRKFEDDDDAWDDDFVVPVQEAPRNVGGGGGGGRPYDRGDNRGGYQEGRGFGNNGGGGGGPRGFGGNEGRNWNEGRNRGGNDGNYRGMARGGGYPRNRGTY